ncbi:MAG: pyridoxamine 5'-phosphate oxidase family protein [Gemmatimonadota bacterium]|nr:pyridoxamine 5'-phosphate oxidase family protein [Gemmatimonadota bacterium]MDH5759690.1 pyridoxamine 5'-phosphate oxidase family protein [Gemmatimonadota bacterium]
MTTEAGAEQPVGTDPRAALRRRDRGKDEEWIRAFLRVAPMGFFATVGEDGQPFLNSNLFAFDEERHCIYFHTHRTGRTRDNVADEERVCFSATAMGRMLPALEALEFSVEYCGVVVFGVARIVDGSDEARHGLRILLEKYAPHLEYGSDYRGTTDEELKRTAVYRLDIESWSGKQKEVAGDFPGAYDFPQVPVPFPERSEVSVPPSYA